MSEIELAIRDLRIQFTKSPVNFVVEAELAFRLKNLLNQRLEASSLNAEHDSGASQGSITDHSEYAVAIIESERFDRVHCEVSGSNFGLETDQKRLDLVVFEDSVDLKIKEGSKKFNIEDLQAAVEIKFIKNKHYLRPDSQLYRRIENDLARLNKLPNSLETYFLLFSDFDLARKEEGKQAKKQLEGHYVDVTFLYTHPLKTDFNAEE